MAAASGIRRAECDDSLAAMRLTALSNNVMRLLPPIASGPRPE